MKTKLLAGLLGISLLLNIAGLVFFICFLNLQGHYKAVRRERNQMAQNLTILRGANVVSDTLDSDRICKRNFASLVDAQVDTYGLLPPAITPGNLENTLIVYLHGMGSNYLEPFVYPSGQSIADAIVLQNPNTGFLSCSYRKDASWGNDLAMADITQNIREVLQLYPFKHIILMGTSMGGCTALTYACVAPPDIKEKVEGVVSVESTGDLLALYKTSRHPAIKPAMITAFGGTPEQIPAIYAGKSFLNQLSNLPSTVRIAVVSAKLDKIVPPALQQELVHRLEEKHQPVKLIEIEGGHGAPPAPVYIEGINYVLGKPS